MSSHADVAECRVIGAADQLKASPDHLCKHLALFAFLISKILKSKYRGPGQIVTGEAGAIRALAGFFPNETQNYVLSRRNGSTVRAADVSALGVRAWGDNHD